MAPGQVGTGHLRDEGRVLPGPGDRVPAVGTGGGSGRDSRTGAWALSERSRRDGGHSEDGFLRGPCDEGKERAQLPKQQDEGGSTQGNSGVLTKPPCSQGVRHQGRVSARPPTGLDGADPKPGPQMRPPGVGGPQQPRCRSAQEGVCPSSDWAPPPSERLWRHPARPGQGRVPTFPRAGTRGWGAARGQGPSRKQAQVNLHLRPETELKTHVRSKSPGRGERHVGACLPALPPSHLLC